MSRPLSSKLPIFVGLGSTAALTLINPATGAALGACSVVGIITNAAINTCVAPRINAYGSHVKIVAARVVTVVVSSFVAYGAGIGVSILCLVGPKVKNVLGVEVTLTPSKIGAAISSVAMLILASLLLVRK